MARRLFFTGVVVVTATTLLAGCLRDEGAKSGRLVGSFIDYKGLSNPAYVGRVSTEYSLLEVWNFWVQTEPNNNEWHVDGSWPSFTVLGDRDGR